MNTVVEGIDAKAYLASWLKFLTGMTVADINAIPDEKWSATFGGCTKPASSLIADAVVNLIWTTGALKGEQSDIYSSVPTVEARTATKDGAVAALNEAAENFTAALEASTDEILNSTVMAPWQMPTPVFMLAQISVNHVWYHDGQLNYIHCLLGDGKIHWMS